LVFAIVSQSRSIGGGRYLYLDPWLKANCEAVTALGEAHLFKIRISSSI